MIFSLLLRDADFSNTRCGDRMFEVIKIAKAL